MKKIISFCEYIKPMATIAVVLIAITSVFGLTSCDKENDIYRDPIEDKTEDNKEPETPTYYYDANGWWRLEIDGVKYTLEVRMPSLTTTGTVSANFYYNDMTYVGYAELKNDILTFETKPDEKQKIAIKATFANQDSQKFTADVSIDESAVVAGATFNRMDPPTNYEFAIYFTVVDPDNELPAMGADIQVLNEEVKACNDKTKTQTTDFLTGLLYLSALQAVADAQLYQVMDKQRERYPELSNSHVYVDIKVINYFADISTIYSGSQMTYEHH